MTSLFMGGVVSSGVPADERVVRSTAVPYERDAPAAMQDDMPEPNIIETDPNPHLGMDQRQLASKWHEGSRGVPSWDWEVAQLTESTRQINAQVSTSGTAAAREAAGATNKNLSYAEGIEPVDGLLDGHRMTNTYFVRNPRGVQDGTGNYMSVPPGQDHGIEGNIAAAGKANARSASMASLYNSYWNGGQK